MKISKLIFIFLVLCLGFYFLAGGILGKNGLLYNKSLEEFLIQREYTQDKLTVELNSLVQKQNVLSTDQGLKDAAVKLGYYIQDDGNVFVVSAESTDVAVFAGNIHDSEVVLFNYYSKTSCLLVALIPAAFFTFIIWLVSYLKNRDYSNPTDENDESQGFDDFRA